MNEAEVLQISNQGHIRVLTLNRQERLNALDHNLANALREAISVAQSDLSVWVLVITGAGSSFCTGADLKRDKTKGIDIMDTMQDVYLMLRHGSKPSIALLRGYAYGAGISLALACDFIVAEDDAKIRTNFVDIGLVPDLGITITLPERIGLARSRLMLTTSKAIGASEAESIGLVDQCCAVGTGSEAAMILAQSICERAPLAVSATRKMLHGSRQESEIRLAEEQRLQLAMRTTADHAEGISAFMNKRRPVFQGR